MKKARKIRNRLLSIILAVQLVIGLVPAIPMPAAKAAGVGESWENPILIDSMEKLFEELEKKTSDTQTTYYRLTENLEVKTFQNNIRNRIGENGGYTLHLADKSQCIVGSGLKYLEMAGHDIHYKNDLNCGGNSRSSITRGDTDNKLDSLYLFTMGDGVTLTISNSMLTEDARIWYDGWMNERAREAFEEGPNYTYTAVRNVFRVDTGAVLTVNNTDVKAGRNRKIWIVNAYYYDKRDNAYPRYDGYIYEQIYGSPFVVNGGSVCINGGIIEARGGARNEFNVSGTDSDLESSWMKQEMLRNCLSDTHGNATVRIKREGSKVIINDGEFWACGGADIFSTDEVSGKSYTLKVNGGTFDTSKTDKERLPDHFAAISDGMFTSIQWFANDISCWADCRALRDTLRGKLGIRAKDGNENPVVDFNKSELYVDGELKDGLSDLYSKSDSDTIEVKPIAKKAYSSKDTNLADERFFDIYGLDRNMNRIASTAGDGILYYEKNTAQRLRFSAESYFEPILRKDYYMNVAHKAVCTWTLHEVWYENSVKKVNTVDFVTNANNIYYNEGHFYFLFYMNLDSVKDAEGNPYAWKKDRDYYVTAAVEEKLIDRLHSYSRIAKNQQNVYGQEEVGYESGIRIVFGNSIANDLKNPSGALTYADAVYDQVPQITRSQELIDYGKSWKYQWQIKRGDDWEDYGNWRISVDEAKDIVNRHRDLVGETLRLKLTSYDGTVRGELYSNSRTVEKATMDDDTVEISATVSADAAHAGKYVITIQNNTDMQEYLVIRRNGVNPEDRIENLDWSQATKEKEIDNLGYGIYDIFTRYAETANTMAGSQIDYCTVLAGNVTSTEDVDIVLHNSSSGKPLESDTSRVRHVLASQEAYVVVGSTVWMFSAVPLPYNADDKKVMKTEWSTVDGKEFITPYIRRETVLGKRTTVNYYKDAWPMDKNGVIVGKQFPFGAEAAGKFTLQAKTKLADSTVVKSFTVYVLPDDKTPYRLEEATHGEALRLCAGQGYQPRIKAFPATTKVADNVLLRLVWDMKALNDGDDLSHFSLNETNGEITVLDDALLGEGVIVTATYTGESIEPVTASYQVIVVDPEFKAEDLHEGDAHTYETFRKLDERSHVAVCGCGHSEKQSHEFTKELVLPATYTSAGTMRYVCGDCGYSYEETIPVKEHTHALIWNFDEEEHWQACEEEDCPDAGFESGRAAHEYVLVDTTEEGKEIYACSVCGMVKPDGAEEEKKYVVMNSALATFEGKIGVVFRLELPDYVLEDAGAYALFTKGGKESKFYVSEAVPELVGEKQLYRFTKYVVAKEYRDTINMKLFDGEGNPITVKGGSGTDYTTTGVNYSLETYVSKKKTSSDAKMAALAIALEDYCTAAQIYFEYNAEGLSVSDRVKAVLKSDLDTYKGVFEGEYPAGMKGRSISVAFESDNAFKMIYVFQDDVNPYDFSYRIDDGTASLYEEEGSYFLKTANVAAKNLDKTHAYVITDGTKTYTVICSVLTYARSSVNNGTEARQNLGKALYLYNKAAKSYFAE